jgi:hypothetical protein
MRSVKEMDGGLARHASVSPYFMLRENSAGHDQVLLWSAPRKPRVAHMTFPCIVTVAWIPGDGVRWRTTGRSSRETTP